MRDTRIHKALPLLLKIPQILITSKRHLQIKLNIVLARRRSATVLVPSRPDGNGLFLGFGIGNHEFDVLFVEGLDDEARGHVVVFEVGGDGVLVAPLGVVDGGGQDLLAGEALDCGHIVGSEIVMKWLRSQ